MSHDDDDGFFSRWSQRKARQRRGEPRAEPVERRDATPPVVAPALPVAAAETRPAPSAEPPPTMDDVADLTPASDFSRFVARDVDGGVKNAALKKLFSDPHFNVMDGLDTYIDDYGKPDPLPPGMLRQMAESRWLGLFDDDADPAGPSPEDPPEDPPAAPVPPAATATAASHEDPDLRLQPNHAAGCAGDEPRTGEDAGRKR